MSNFIKQNKKKDKRDFPPIGLRLFGNKEVIRN
jgi:hypothetical protein